MRKYREATVSIDAADPEGSVADLIAAGADPRTRDARGNTALHYVTDCGDMAREGGLTDIDVHAEKPDIPHGRGAATRRLFNLLLDQGVDVQVRNDAGQTPTRLLLDSGGAWMGKRERFRYICRGPGIERAQDEVEGETLGKLEAAGADWNERDSRGRTLLHAVAAHDTERTVWRCKFLLGKGVDPSIRDIEGKTAEDLAWGNFRVIKALQKAEAV
jgi:hypothetical protein